MGEISEEYYLKKYPASAAAKKGRDLKTAWEEAMSSNAVGNRLFKKTPIPKLPYLDIVKELRALNQAAQQLPPEHQLRRDIGDLVRMLPVSFARGLTVRRIAQAEKPAKLFPAGSLEQQALQEQGINKAVKFRFKDYLTPAAGTAKWDKVMAALIKAFENRLKAALGGQ